MQDNSSRVKVAILGSTGHIGMNILRFLSQEKKYSLFLFSREENKTIKIANTQHIGNSFSTNTYDSFDKFEYDVIINCIGVGNPEEIRNRGSAIIKITEKYDNKILNYLENNPSSLYINFSSGVVYGEEFNIPAEDTTLSKLNVNNPSPGYFYSIAKIYSEAKHRSMNHLNIVDLRLFGFFSRFIDPNSRFFMSEVISAIKNKKILLTNKVDIIRDYIHPKDLFLLVERCIMKNSINDAFDAYSKSPVSKFMILNHISQKYDLKYIIKQNEDYLTPTGIKEKYYSCSRKAESIGYSPTYSSLETIEDEIKFLI